MRDEADTKQYVFFTDPADGTRNLGLTRRKTATAFKDVKVDCPGTIAQEGFSKLASRMRDAMKSEAVGSIGRFVAAGRAYVHFALDNPGYMRIMFRPELGNPIDRPRVDDAAAEAMGVLIACVRECQSAGTIAGTDPMPIVLTSWATAHGLAALLVDGPLPRLHPCADPREMTRTVAYTLGLLLALTKRGSK